MNAIYDILGVPFGFILKFIFDTVGNYGLALILFTLFARLLMFPSSISTQKGTAKTQRLQPKLRKIQEKYKGDSKKIQEETQALYQREGHNPMNAGCLPLVIQMPIIFGLIGVIYNPLKYALQITPADITALTAVIIDIFPKLAKSRTLQLAVIENIHSISNFIKYLHDYPKADISTLKTTIISYFQSYSPSNKISLSTATVNNIIKLLSETSAKSINKISSFNFSFLGLDLGKTPNQKVFDKLWVVPILSGISSLATGVFTWFKQKQTNPEMAKNPAMGCMTFGMPLFSTYFTFLFPVGIGIYWIASNVFAFAQTVLLSFTHNPKKMIAKLMIEEAIQRRSKEQNLKLVASRKENN